MSLWQELNLVNKEEKNVDVIELIGIHGTNYEHSSMDRGWINSVCVPIHLLCVPFPVPSHSPR